MNLTELLVVKTNKYHYQYLHTFDNNDGLDFLMWHDHTRDVFLVLI
jgi:hypothetical protein